MIATSTALLIAAGVTAAAATGVTAYQASAEKTQQKKALGFQEAQQNKLLSYQESQVKAAEEKVAGAEALAAQTAKDEMKKRRLSQTNSILTSPLGIPGEANLGLSTLLGGK
jgi:negative regulator of sigma E activity